MTDFVKSWFWKTSGSKIGMVQHPSGIAWSLIVREIAIVPSDFGEYGVNGPIASSAAIGNWSNAVSDKSIEAILRSICSHNKPTALPSWKP